LTQLSLLPQALTRTPRFAGPGITPADAKRLTGQLSRVRDYMSDGRWHTLAVLSRECRGTETAVSARIRDLRRLEGRTVDRRRITAGIWEYRLVPEGQQ
jgi:hypothetical protein